MRYFQAAAFLALLMTIGIFAIQNRDVVTVAFLGWDLQQPVALVTLAVYFLGMISGWTVVAFARLTFRRATQHPGH